MTSRRRFLLLSIIVLFAVLIDAGPVTAAATRPTPFTGHRWKVSNNCGQCHIGTAAIKFRHPLSRFFKAAHGRVKCVRCHANDRYVLSRARCETCHRQRHGPAIVNRCGRCHNVISWRPATPEHRGKLRAGHVTLTCRQCHKNNRYSGLNWTCVACHNDRHGNSVSNRCKSCHNQAAWKPVKMNHAAVTGDCPICHVRPSSHAAGTCGNCHTTTAWRPASGAHTISLKGVHTSQKCVACHKNGSFTGLSWRCKSCHAVKHPSSYAVTCVSCHNQKSWKPAKMNYGAAKGDCSACHKAPTGHFSTSCNQCHQASRGWTAQFNHPGVREHSYKSFPCNNCHPSGYTSYTCTRCHQGGAPSGD